MTVFAISFWVLPDHRFSDVENRGLQTLPHASSDALVSGVLSEQVNLYFADQFPMRDRFVSLKSTLEMLLGKGENNGILAGEGGQLAKRLFLVMRKNGGSIDATDLFDPAHIDGATEGINRAATRLQVPFSVLLTGRTIDVAASAFSYPTQESDALAARLREKIEPTVSYLDMIPSYRQRYELGEYVYYRTDHHWTTLGAYYAYAEVMRSFDMEGEILPQTAFARTVVSSDFYGTFASASGIRTAVADEVEIWYRGNESSFTVTADGAVLAGGFYTLSHLEGRDHYSVFLDGTHDVVTVQKNGEESRPVLLIAKDSFANALAPFLAQHFDLVMLNLSSTRRDFTNLTEQAAHYGADAVLVVYTLGNVINTDRMNRLQ